MGKDRQKLTPESIQEIEEIISREKDAQVSIRRGKLVVWETSSKKKYETTVAIR